MKKQNKTGFSLLELILVLGVGTTVTFMKFQDMKNEQETVVAKAVGEQIKQMGEAVNGYINIRYDKLSTLTSSTNQSSDPGPRTCSGSVCEITYQTLVNEGLLPSSFSGVNAQKSSYKIFLRRSGNVPNYIINGLITTTNVWADGGKVRYDLLGKAMQAAGIDSGMTKTTTAASGYGGQWSELSTDYSNITAAGLLAYRVGYDSSMYSVYLRRDGTLPMTGDLNMGGNSINNAKDLNGTGNLTMGGSASVGSNVSAGGVIATNGLSVSDRPAGWSGGVRTFDVYASGGYYLTYAGKAASTQDWAYSVNNNGNANIRTDLTVGGSSAPLSFPTGWYGTGIKTFDLYSAGSVGAGDRAGNLKAYLNGNGDIYASGNIHVDNNAYVNGTISSGGDINVGKRLNAWEYVYVNGQAGVGGGCSPNGLIGRDGSGKILSCVNGVWSSLGGTSRNIALYQCPYNICDNNSASTCSGQISTMNYCQCRQGGAAISCPYIGKLIAD
ncbi:shufflon system plasmid conjugative transfer pilus tip adhesin PilV [Dickeya zeae]|uniref:shufflon system plasmid conjugative transfer pilus tip adhesin PilV n=1 Tax=Dickeya zeae TaxID=204042 RepID=UPI000C9C74C0|nr:shufflon system plasmid conjugative transfer pilus tip adhesin PilV [Dickeya zeae]AUQ25133.1 shufflon system plasmid conjugative transfer pilus tip adhesin PilV [Dickeya zeae]UJR58214.1 shufflon system plasmid conjugative transfer pilus tip adhesin PilV [Dickeya zeae]